MTRAEELRDLRRDVCAIRCAVELGRTRSALDGLDELLAKIDAAIEDAEQEGGRRCRSTS